MAQLKYKLIFKLMSLYQIQMALIAETLQSEKLQVKYESEMERRHNEVQMEGPPPSRPDAYSPCPPTMANGGSRGGLYGEGRRTAVAAEAHSPPHVQRASLALA